MVDVHNRVNARLRKPIITYREAEEIYSAPASFQNDNEKENEEDLNEDAPRSSGEEMV